MNFSDKCWGLLGLVSTLLLPVDAMLVAAELDGFTICRGLQIPGSRLQAKFVAVLSKQPWTTQDVIQCQL